MTGAASAANHRLTTDRGYGQRVDELGGRGDAGAAGPRRRRGRGNAVRADQRETGGRPDWSTTSTRFPTRRLAVAFWEHPISVWDDQCGVGLRGYYVASAFAAPLMVEHGQRPDRQHLVRGAARVSHSAPPTVSPRPASTGWREDMALELTARCAALSLAPGAVRTEFMREAVAGVLSNSMRCSTVAEIHRALHCRARDGSGRHGENRRPVPGGRPGAENTDSPIPGRTHDRFGSGYRHT